MTNKVISVASSKGGIGKSTVAIGLSQALAAAGHKVLLADLDFGNACLDLLLGVEDDVLYTVADAAEGRCPASSAVIKLRENENLCLLPAPAGGTRTCTDKEALKKVLTEAADAAGAEFTVLDTGAGVNPAADAAFEISNTVLAIAGHSPVSIRAAQSTAGRIASVSTAAVKLVINPFDTDEILKHRLKKRCGMLEIIDRSGIPLAGVIPYDYALQLSAENAGIKCSPNTAKAFENTAQRLCGKNVPLFCGMKKNRKKRNILFS